MNRNTARSTRIETRVVGLIALAVVGFLLGLRSASRFVPNLDVDVYNVDPVRRVLGWAILCAMGCILFGFVVLIAIDLHHRRLDSDRRKKVSARIGIQFVAIVLLFLPAWVIWAIVFEPRPAVIRADCTNHLKQIAVAMLAYHDDFGSLPPAFVADELGNPKHSWRVLLLPYLAKGEGDRSGLKALYDSYDMNEPWNGPNNRKLAGRMPRVYGCINDRGRNRSTTSYLVITGNGSAFPANRSIKLGEIVDDKASTIITVEVGDSGINWLEPRDYPIDELRFVEEGSSKRGIGGNHPRGANVGFADGSVQFLSDVRVKSGLLRSLATIDGREKIGDFP